MRCVKSAIPLLMLMSIASMVASPVIASAQVNSRTVKEKVTIKGRVYCLDRDGRRSPVEQDCKSTEVRYELAASDGKLYPLLADDLLATIFTESRVRKMELLITGVRDSNNQLELAKIQALRDGKVMDIFYYCEVCKITAYGPGPCPCCYEPLGFIEKPANEK